MLEYEILPEELEARILRDREEGTMPDIAFRDKDAIRRDPQKDIPTALRPPFVRDIDKIMHCPFYNRYADKTQVFSFYKNDDITRRALHVQLVSRIARTIGRALNLNLDLIEAISLGHDIGHTPFGHAGETYLDESLAYHTGLRFSHNIQSVRVLDTLFPYNLTLQTLNGIASHDGELELSAYYPQPISDFGAFDSAVQACTKDAGHLKKLVPATLEGCVMRISDIIAYLGKDRQDAERAKLAEKGSFSDGAIGVHNAQIINNLTVNIITHSYGKPYIKMDDEHFEALCQAKADNYAYIYRSEEARAVLDNTVRPMMAEMFDKLLRDLQEGRKESPIFSHHIRYVNNAYYQRTEPYGNTEPARVVADYIASMTDDYFVDLHAFLFPKSRWSITYKGHFNN